MSGSDPIRTSIERNVLAAATHRAVKAVRRFAADRRGVAAVEFAFIAPLMFAMYFVTVELAQGIESNKRVGRIGSMVADLITQQQTMTKSELEAIMKIGESLIQPYDRTRPTIVVTAIEVTPAPNSKVQVAWSRKMTAGSFSQPFTKGSTASLPAALNTSGSFIIRVESDLSYKPMVTWAAGQKDALGLASAFDGIAMKETYYLRPRISSTIPCADC